MDSNRSKILFPINALVVRDSLELPQLFTQNLDYFAEESLIEQFKHAIIEDKRIFYSKIINPDISIETKHFPIDINLFNEES